MQEGKLLPFGPPKVLFRGSARNDWIDQFISSTEDVNSPQLFRRWAAISCLAGVMERRLWTYFGSGRVYPNLYVILVAGPGIGKTQALTKTAKLFRGTKVVHVAPDSVSSASLIDCMEAAYRGHLCVSNNELMEYHALQICADEMGILLPEYNTGTLSLLSGFYDDSRENFSEEKRTNHLKKNLTNPILNLICGATPDFLADTIPAVAWGQGFMSRMLLIYSADKRLYDIRGKFDYSEEKPLFSLEMRQYIRDICDLAGAFRWSPSAQEALAAWHDVEYTPRPEHPRLQHYCQRRMTHTIKLSMVASIARTKDLQVSLADFELARSWLFEAEAVMPGIFADMSGKGDTSIILDLQQYLLAKQREFGSDFVRPEVMYTYLGRQVQSERVPRVVQMAEAMKVLQVRVDGIYTVDPMKLIEGKPS